ncbi:acyl-CoA dehydrogenase family protein [Phycisphaera mikurensis]|uniref:Putative acyl-CoA dehydrogenase n=1 Tax=Phycisphaera mikurensis (strain NBRC 102666 / KCTC 22515 / FYK2301M01) TaxID=1142394 RepID=I0IFI0_PHYMF|nr:acyl-CoA dehydrogenase family protein [Phycisphaera mikurensis]MBB6440590.1 alkylation response protein AidB-like acyl-CoA dehydrogenase [Phycisphaera mikurensis]BAM04018.1 putative acyl-CoA dehydrogenase [Phycisphaera mikurensis NBRC 102666]
MAPPPAPAAAPCPATERGKRADPEDRSLLAAIDGRAAAADRGEADLSREVAALRRAGWLAAPLPAADGGLGWGTEPAGTPGCFTALRQLGRVSLPVARIFEGHVNAVALVALYGADTLRGNAFDAIRGGGCFGVWGADAPGDAVTLRGEGEALRLAGAKDYASGLGLLSHAVVSARVEAGTQLLLVPVGDAARGRGDTWRLAGMRATRSGRYRFDGVDPGADAELGGPDDWFREPHFEGGVWRYCAAHLGAAERLFAEMRDALAARDRAGDPHQQVRLVRAAVAVESARLWIERAARRVQAADAHADAAAVSLLAREVTQDACRDVVRIVEEALGLAAHAWGPIERTRRDLAAFVCQAAPDDKRARAAEALVARGVLPEHL